MHALSAMLDAGFLPVKIQGMQYPANHTLGLKGKTVGHRVYVMLYTQIIFY